MVIAGNPGLVEQPLTRGFNAQSGPFIQRSWRGTLDACNGASSEIAGAEYWEISPDGGGVYTLRARFATDPIEPPGTEVPTREERLQWNQTTKKLEASPAFSTLSDTIIAKIRKNIDAADTAGTIRAGIVSEGGAAAGQLWDLLRRGIESVPVYQPIVIVTDTASLAYPWNIGFENVGKIFVTAGMIDDAALSSGWAANLPNETPPSGFYFGWRKKPPEIVTAGGNRTQLVQEYEYGLWEDDIYELA